MTTGPMAGRQHDGALTTWCTCGATFTSGDTSALVHRREEGCA